MALFGGLFGEKFQNTWKGDADNAGLRDKLGVLGVGLSQLSAGQAPNILPAWQAVEDRRAKRKLGEAMGNPELLAGFTPEQQKMLSVMPPEMAQSLIMEKMFAPPVAPEYREFNGDLYDMSGGTPSVVLDGMSGDETATAKAAAERARREQDAAFLGYQPGSPEFNQYVVTGEMPKPQSQPAAVDEYNFYAAQEEAAGRQPLSFNDWDLQGKKAGATTVNNTLSTGTDSSTKPGQVFDEMKASAESARAAQTGLLALEEAEKALNGGVITGFAADERLYLSKLGSYLGITDPQMVENTETFRSAIAPQVAAMLKATVGSAQISNSDREFAEKAAGGSIALDEASIKRLVGIMRKGSEAVVARHQNRLNEVYPEGSGADRERALFGVGGSDAPKAAEMSDEEYLKSLGLD